jgi:1-acyl-sn-glycerol-3-phosphate acyltransferase
VIKAKLPERVGAAATRATNRLPVNGRAFAVLARAALPRPRDLVPRLPFPYGAPTVPDGVEPDRPRSRVGADFETAWARSYPARAARVLLVEGVVRPAVTALAAPIVLGRDRLDEVDGPVVFAANHHSHVDTPLLQSVIPEPWRHHLVIGAAADYFFGNRVTGTLSALVIGAVPIERTRISRRSADDAADLIDDGWSFVIFPEGGRSPDGWGQPFQPGAAYLSVRCGVPVVPVYIGGTTRILRKGNTLPRLSITRVVFGSPMTAQEGETSRRFAARIETTVSSLGDEGRTDWYEARKRLHAGETPSLRGPAGEVGAWRRTWELGDRSPIRRRQKRAWPDLGR